MFRIIQNYYIGKAWVLIQQAQEPSVHVVLHDALGLCRTGEVSLRLIMILRHAIRNAERYWKMYDEYDTICD